MDTRARARNRKKKKLKIKSIWKDIHSLVRAHIVRMKRTNVYNMHRGDSQCDAWIREKCNHKHWQLYVVVAAAATAASRPDTPSNKYVWRTLTIHLFWIGVHHRIGCTLIVICCWCSRCCCRCCCSSYILKHEIFIGVYSSRATDPRNYRHIALAFHFNRWPLYAHRR